MISFCSAPNLFSFLPAQTEKKYGQNWANKLVKTSPSENI